jgi:flavodoxin I
MRALIVYDSVFGNTEKVAQAMRDGLAEEGEITLRRVGEVQPQDLPGLDLLIAGSPTRKFSPTPAMTSWLKGLPQEQLDGVKVAGFDTRVNVDKVNSWVLSGFVKVFGYAAEPISARLQKKGGDLAVAPAGFFVGGTEGPLQEGELERAAEWARQAAAK